MGDAEVSMGWNGGVEGLLNVMDVGIRNWGFRYDMRDWIFDRGEGRRIGNGD